MNSLTQCWPQSVCSIKKQSPIAGKGKKEERGYPPLDWRIDIKVTQSSLKHFLSGLAKNAADCFCVSWTAFHTRGLGYLCVSLFLTHVHTWIISKESVIRPYKQKNETGCSQTTYLEHFLWWASQSVFHKVWSVDCASDAWRCWLEGLASQLAWHPGICHFIRLPHGFCFLQKFKSIWPWLLT